MQEMTQTLTVALGERAYPIHIGSGLLSQGALIAPYIRQKKAVIVTNTTVAPLYLDILRSTLEKAQISCQSVVLPDGEQLRPGKH